jgi:hypothetical protein
MVELDGKVTCSGDKHFSLSFSRCALPWVTGEKKVEEEASVATGQRGLWRLASDGGGMRSDDGSGVWGQRTGSGDEGVRCCYVSEEDREKAYGGCTEAFSPRRIWRICTH